MLALFIAFLSLTVTAFASALPPKLPIATRTFYLPDGSTKDIELPPGIEFISTYTPATGGANNYTSPAKRLTWHPGHNDKWISDLEDDPKNQGFFQALAGGDINANGNWCRLQYHNTCVFGIRTHSMYGAQVGSHDIRDMIWHSMDAKPGRDKMQFEGQFQCCTWGGPMQTSVVEWAIFKPL